MGPESLLARWWSAVRPLPATQSLDKATLAKKRRQRGLILYSVVFLMLVGAAWYAYSYVSSAPQRAMTEFQKGMTRMRPGTYSDAITFFDKSIDIWPNLPEAYLNRGIALHNLSQRDAALDDFERAVALNPSLTRAYDERGQIYIENREPEKALKEFTKSLSIEPNTDAYYQRANLYESIGEHQKALEDYDRAIGEMVGSPYAYRARAIAKEKLGDTDGAKEDRAKALRLEDYR